jgi:hypothetical protein
MRSRALIARDLDLQLHRPVDFRFRTCQDGSHGRRIGAHNAQRTPGEEQNEQKPNDT